MTSGPIKKTTNKTTGTARAAPERKSRAKPDALDLWTHEDRLTEAMRAGGYKMTPPAYAAASMDGCLHGHGVTVRVVEGVRVYSAGEDEFARLRFDGSDLVLQFVAPENKETLASVVHFYQPVPNRPGWLEYRRPATRDPRPGLEAKLGQILGQAAFERRR